MRETLTKYGIWSIYRGPQPGDFFVSSHTGASHPKPHTALRNEKLRLQISTTDDKMFAIPLCAKSANGDAVQGCAAVLWTAGRMEGKKSQELI
ncbi:MAG: hypothetical protein A2Z25_20085 [Planctomycetes bacterium RBG_16_55_9]|nr:MAG: hypothetical protein A2Z25_20085 [Planctomycetes bacterium RBG_16_55_9]